MMMSKEIIFRYSKSKKGVLTHAHANMTRRCRAQHNKWLKYLGLEVLPKIDFVEWSTKDKTFNKLYDTWVQSNYDFKYTPTVDRLNPSFGYTLDNINWCTQSENSKRQHQMNKVR